MSKSSIYETSWTNLVFENKNQEYGAYQLRQENSKTTITALFLGLLLLASLGTASLLINKFGTSTTIDNTPPPFIDPHIVVVDVDPIVVPPTPPAPEVQPQSAASPAPDMSQLSHPVVVTSQQAVDNIATNAQNVPSVDNATPGTGIIDNVIPTGGNGGDPVAPIINTNEPVITTALDKLPEFPGGMNKFYTYVGNNFNKPELEAEKTLRVYVSFVIERDGSITDVMVKNDPGYGMAKEAIRVLKSLKTKWIPGMIAGKPVRTAYNLPITIKTEAE